MDIQTKDGILLRGIPEGTPDEVIKERIAKIRAGGGLKTQVQPQEPSFLDRAKRTAGLGTRAVVRVATAIPTMMDDIAAVPLRAMTGGKYFESPSAVLDRTMTQAGLPEPANAPERITQDVLGTMSGVAGLAKGAEVLGRGASSVAAPYLNMLSKNQGALIASGAGAGAGGGIAREAGDGPLGQFGASLAGGMVPPVAGAAGRWAGNKLGDIGATVGASFGNQRGIERIAKDAAQRIAGESRAKQLAALMNAEEYAPGVKPTAAEAIAQANLGRPEQFGGATIRLQKDLSGAKGIEDVLPSAVRQQRNSLAAHLKDVKAQTKPMRETALAGANTGGVMADSINAKIDAAMAVPGQRASDVVQKTLGTVKEKINSLADQTGRIDARDLYTVRKEIGNTIQKFSKETANWGKKLSGRLERDLQLYIDDAIEGAGGTGWKDYLKTYSTGLRAVDNQLLRQREAKLIGAGVKGSNAANLAAGEVPHPPTLLSRPMMFLNYLLRGLVGDANTPVSKYMAEQMRDPKAYAKLLRGVQEKGTTSDAARRAALAAMIEQGQNQ